MRFYLGTHCTEWTARTDVPLFLSARRLRIRRCPAVHGPWALDSGGFSELNARGAWSVDAPTYAAEVRRWSSTIGRMEWAAVQDWMCEPWILGKTGLSVREHQRRTLESYRQLLDLAPDVPWVPVLQGWHPEDYVDHVHQYLDAGLPLHEAPVVGVGSVCRRQATEQCADIFLALAPFGLRLHGFGLKQDGLLACARLLHSADSMAWSYRARRHDGPMFLDCPHRKCASCLRWALAWRRKVLRAARRGETVPLQRRLFV